MDCSKCGLELPDDAKFCTFCGEPTDSLTSRPIQPTQPAPYQRTSVTTTRSSNNAGRIIAALCIIFVVGILFLFGLQFIFRIQMAPNTGISIFIIGAIMICCIGGNLWSTGNRRRRGSECDGGCCYCSGCDCGDCDCGDCDCGGCDC